MLIAQISDLHLAGPGQMTLGNAPMAENLARCITHINHLTRQPDLVLVTGDITHNGLVAEAEQAAVILAQLHIPYYIIPGNHDNRETLVHTFGSEHCLVDENGFVNYVIDGYDLRLIALDSTIPGAPGGEICAQRAAWLAEQLEQDRERPTLLFMHHPPAPFGVIETDIDGFIGADRLGDVLEQHPQVLRILAGHIHLASLTTWRGVVISTAPSMGMRLFLDLTLQQPSAYILDIPGYQLHYWRPNKQLITHTVRVQEPETIHLF